MNNEVRLTLNSFMSLCKLAMDTHEEKERLRKIVVMQNDALEKLSSPPSVEKRWIKEFYELKRRQMEAATPLPESVRKQVDASTADLDMRDKHGSEFWPPLGMIP